MTHRVEQVLARVKVLLQATATAGGLVMRSRRYLLPEGVTAALFLSQGDDLNLPEETPFRVRSEVDVQIDAVVATTGEEDVEPRLNQIRTEVNQQLAAQVNLGLPNVVVKCWELGAGEPVVDNEATPTTGRMRLAWRVQYGRNRNDPET